MKTERFKTKDGNNHVIDTVGNHFINGKCVNPTMQSGKEIGSTYPPIEDIVKA